MKKNIFLIGPTGSGKTSIGFELSKILNMTFIDSDKEIEKENKKSINDIFNEKGEEFFRKEEEKIIDKITSKSNIILSTGGGAVKSKINRLNLISRGYIIYLKTSIENQLIRLKECKDRPLLFNDINKNEILLKNMSKTRNHLYEKLSNIIIDTNDKKIECIVEDIIKILKIKESELI